MTELEKGTLGLLFYQAMDEDAPDLVIKYVNGLLSEQEKKRGMLDLGEVWGDYDEEGTDRRPLRFSFFRFPNAKHLRVFVLPIEELV